MALTVNCTVYLLHQHVQMSGMMFRLVDMDPELRTPATICFENRAVGQEGAGTVKRKIGKSSSDTYQNIEDSGISWQKGVAQWGPALVLFSSDVWSIAALFHVAVPGIEKYAYIS